MQRSRLPPRAFALLAKRLPIPLQRFPDGFPILRRRFHNYFFSLLLEQPCGQRPQLFGGAAKLPSLKRLFAFDFDVTYHYSQHLFVNIDTRYLIGHSSSWPGVESVLRFLKQGRGLSSSPQRREQRRPIIRSNTHAPDQTASRLRLLQ